MKDRLSEQPPHTPAAERLTLKPGNEVGPSNSTKTVGEVGTEFSFQALRDLVSELKVKVAKQQHQIAEITKMTAAKGREIAKIAESTAAIEKEAADYDEKKRKIKGMFIKLKTDNEPKVTSSSSCVKFSLESNSTIVIPRVDPKDKAALFYRKKEFNSMRLDEQNLLNSYHYYQEMYALETNLKQKEALRRRMSNIANVLFLVCLPIGRRERRRHQRRIRTRRRGK